jgi:hypothetical protein
MDGDGV